MKGEVKVDSLASGGQGGRKNKGGRVVWAFEVVWVVQAAGMVLWIIDKMTVTCFRNIK